MASLYQLASEHPIAALLLTPILLLLAQAVSRLSYNLYLHPLAKYPGPRFWAATTYGRAYVQCFQRKSNCHEYARLHEIYGPIIRVSPNELHFADPAAFNDIYNNRNRWDKEESLYHSFGEDESSFGYIHYGQAKERRDILLRMFSPKAIESSQNVVKEKIRHLCSLMARQNKEGKSCDIFYAYRSMTMDILTYLCYGNSINAMDEPEFKAPLVEAMHTVTPLAPMLQHFWLYKYMIQNMPPKLSVKLSPETAGLVRMQELLKKQIDHHVSDPGSLNHLPHSTTIFHVLLDPEAYANKQTPTAKSLYQESQALMFGGVETTASALMIATFYMLKNPDMLKKLKQELYELWPDLGQEPELRDLEKLPYMNAILKETNRIGPSIPTPLPRVVPPTGAKIGGERIPAGTIVSMSYFFLHNNPSIFPNPSTFDPTRWLGPDATELEKWLVPFSKGPRACIGMNLAWCELRICFAHLMRKFEGEIDPAGFQGDHIPFIGVFSPYFPEPHLRAWMRPVEK